MELGRTSEGVPIHTRIWGARTKPMMVKRTPGHQTKGDGGMYGFLHFTDASGTIIACHHYPGSPRRLH